ncbi:hypothetical protein L211DRAFT_531589 [Terfezia boudieri ATCC MYA-4762]|uniref:Uncharacterized protein n=1 Tax=Terfezia boudieri ATCC MYA-4762 TaxID=1051890 RepID=A0A3N4LQH6_9PEZI|nr:hypothetical protein L211DRAFT_531589 [Terfezia boudieri ATCC MYA-4762]
MDTPAYRPPRQIPASLRDTLKIILEEELCISTTPNATDNSDDNLTSTANLPPIYIPPAIHLTLLTTLLSHPTFTTHVSKKTDLESRLVSPSSERFLLRLLTLAGPNSMGLHTAWDRWDGTPSGSNGLWATQRGGTPVADDAFEDNSLDLRFAGKESLFERAEDFWAVVGWGFSCACAEIGYGVDAEKARALRRRWGAWRRLLRVMVEGLERDWEERVRGEEGDEKKERREKRDVKKLVPLTKEEQKEARKREILEGCSTEDEEEDEDEEDGNWAGDSKRDVDLDGDHTMAEASDSAISKPDSATSAWGGIEAVLLRQRLLILLSSVCHHQQWIPLSTLHDELTDHLLSPNPFSISLPSIRLFTTLLVTNSSLSFTHLTSPPPPSHIYLHPLFSSLLRTLLSSDAPSPSNYGALEDRGGLISPKVLVTCYLPYRAKAGTLKDNLKVSVLLEQLVRAIATEGGGVKELLGEDGGG